MDQLIDHLRTARVHQDELEEGDIVTAVVVVMKVERIDQEEPSFCVAHSGDYITAAGLLDLGRQIGLDNVREED